ncbi:MAG: hypothetical protein F4Z28_13450 [Gammaproteobacteria bacterium]|nr:hypothetical protein [Gammaproteobacteria bacterium]
MTFRPRFNADLGGDVGVVDLARWVLEWDLVAGKESGASYANSGVPLVFRARLNNDDGRFSRTNPDSPYAGRLEGGGFIDVQVPGEGRLVKAKLLPFKVESGQNRSQATLTAVGVLYQLQQAEISVPLQRTIRSDELFGYILRRSGIGAGQQDLSEGTQILPAFWSPRARAYDIAQAPVIFEGGHAYDSRDYAAVFLSRTARGEDPLDQVRARVGGAGNIRASAYDDGDQFDVLINRAVVPFSAYNTGEPGLLWEWAGELLVPGWELFVTEDGAPLVTEAGERIIVEAPVEQNFAVEISVSTPSAVDWAQCTLQVSATVGDISADCQIAPISATEALVSVPRRESAYEVTAITVRGPIVARDPLGQEPYQDAVSIALYDVHQPEVVPSWHSDRVAARQQSVDLVLGLKERATIAMVSFAVRGAAADAWKRWISDRIGIDVLTREGVRIRSTGVIEQLRLFQTGIEDPLGSWTLSGVGRGLASDAGISLPSVLNQVVTAGEQLTFTLPPATGGMGTFEYDLPGLPDWLTRDGFQVSGTAPLESSLDILTWTATDSETGITIGRAFSVAVALIVLDAPQGLRDAGGTSESAVSARWLAVPNAAGYETRIARTVDEITLAPWEFLSNVLKQFRPLEEATPYRIQVRAAPAAGSVYDYSPYSEIIRATLGEFTLGDVSDVFAAQGDEVRFDLPPAQGGSGNFTYTLTGGPDWLVRDGLAVSGLVDDDRTREYELTFTARDDDTGPFYNFLSREFTISVRVDFAMDEIGDLALDSGDELDVELPAAVGGDGDYYYELTGAPDWVSLAGRTLGGLATFESATHTLTWTVTDGTGASIARSFDLVVTAPIALPAIPDVQVSPGDELEIQLPDAIGGVMPIEYELTGQPDWLVLSGSTLSGTAPNLATDRTWRLTWIATDADDQEAYATALVTLDVPLVLPAISDIWVLPAGTLDQTLPAATGGDGDYTYAVAGAPSWVQVAGRRLTGTVPNASSTDTLTLTVTDGTGESASRQFRLVARPAAPLTVAAIEDVELTAGDALDLSLPDGAGGTAPYTYALTGAPSWVNRSTRALSGTAPAAASSDQLTWTVTDNAGVSVSRTFRLIVELPVLAAPTNLAIAAVGNTALDVSWDAAPNATGYQVRWAAGAAAPTGAWTDASGTSHRITGLTAGSTYQVEVRATAPGYTASAPVAGGSTLPLPQLGALQDLAIVSTAEDSITVRWSPVANATRYEVRHAAGAPSGSWRSIGAGTVSGQHRTTVISGLEASTGYTVQVRAAAAGYRAGTHAEVSGSTAAPTTTELPAPQNLAIGDATSTSLRVTWSTVENADGYELRYAEGSGAPTGAWAAATSPHVLNGLESSTEHTVQVRAVGSGQYRTGPHAQESGETLIGPPANLLAQTIDEDAITWAWDAARGAADYQYRHALASESFPNSWTTVSGTSVQVGSLAANSTYKIQVRSRSSGGELSVAVQAQARTAASGTLPQLGTPQLTGSYDSDDNLVRVSWPAVTNATAYAVRLTVVKVRNGVESSSTTTSSSASRVRNFRPDAETRRVEYEVRATADGYRASAPASISILVGIPLAAPNVSVAAGSDRFTLSWPAIANASSYEYRYAQGSSAPTGAWIAVTTTSVTVGSLNPGTGFTAQVRAVGQGDYITSPATQVAVTTATFAWGNLAPQLSSFLHNDGIGNVGHINLNNRTRPAALPTGASWQLEFTYQLAGRDETSPITIDIPASGFMPRRIIGSFGAAGRQASTFLSYDADYRRSRGAVCRARFKTDALTELSDQTSISFRT